MRVEGVARGVLPTRLLLLQPLQQLLLLRDPRGALAAAAAPPPRRARAAAAPRPRQSQAGAPVWWQLQVAVAGVAGRCGWHSGRWGEAAPPGRYLGFRF